MNILSRRHLFALGAGASVAALGGCGLFTQNANGSYGLSAAVIAFIQSAVQTVANYVPAIESIAATAASLFGAGYSAIVAVGSAAVNQIITYLENLVANPPTLGARLSARAYRLAGAVLPTGSLVGYAKVPAQGGGFAYVPVFAQ